MNLLGRCLDSVEKLLSPSQSEGFLSSEELLNSVRSLNNGKSPGSDGLSVEFYLQFLEVLGPLIDVLLTANCVPQ